MPGKSGKEEEGQMQNGGKTLDAFLDWGLFHFS